MFLDYFLEFLFPHLCVGCGKEGHFLCSDCHHTLKFCEQCEVPGNSLDSLYSIFLYEKHGIIPKLLHLYKYDCLHSAGEILQSLFSSSFGRMNLPAFDFLTWVPLTPKKFKNRGFNQAQSFAKAINLPKNTAKLLCKIQDNSQQMTLDKVDRVKNVMGVYSIARGISEDLFGKTVIILDDVATTLSTLNECARILKMAGARSVIGVVLTRQEA